MDAGDLQQLLPMLLVGMAVLAWPGRGGAVRSFVPLSTGRKSWWELVRPDGGRFRRKHEPNDLTVPDVLDLLALALDSGASTGRALRAVSDRLPGSVGAELRSVAAALEWGLPDDAAWSAAPPRWEPAGRALRLAARAGVPPAGLLRHAAEDARRERLSRVEVATARLGVRLVLPLGLAFLPAFVLTTVLPVVLALAGSLLSGADVGLMMP